MIYATCGKELEISDAEQDYLKQKFTSVSKGYQSAYQDAYVNATNAVPPQSFVNDVVKKLTMDQQDAVDHVALVIREKGCRSSALRAFPKYVHALYKQDKEIANYQPAAPAQPYQ